MDKQPVFNAIDSSDSISASTPSAINPSEKLPDIMTPEEYLRNSDTLLDRNHPEAFPNNFLLFSPLLPILVFTFISLSVIGFYVNQQQQVAEIRSKAQITPCASGSDPMCINPGDSCGKNNICVANPNNGTTMCECLEKSSIPSISITPSPIVTTQTNTKGLEIIVTAAGIVLTLIVLILWGRRKTVPRK